jgi:hypothetical protein
MKKLRAESRWRWSAPALKAPLLEGQEHGDGGLELQQLPVSPPDTASPAIEHGNMMNTSATAGSAEENAGSPVSGSGTSLSLADSILSDKFQSDSKFLVFARVHDAIHGVAEAVGLGDPVVFSEGIRDGVKSIEAEFQQNGTAEDKRWLQYVLYEKARHRGPYPQEEGSENVDVGHDGMLLAHFLAHRSASVALLTRAHVLALRLYTTACYRSINNALRERRKPHPLRWTVYFISQAISKLRVVTADMNTIDRPAFLWRGMKDVQVPAEFERRGGTELACLSTTKSETVARKFATLKAQEGEGKKSAVLLKLRMTSPLSIGASIKFLSAYPGEEEYLYPPLTFLRPCQAASTEDNVQVLTVEPTLPGA